MSRFVVDASIVLTWCFPDEHSEQALRVSELFKEGGIALVPAFWPHEVLSALLVGERRKRISAALVHSFLDDLAALPISLDTSDPAYVSGAIHAICREHGLTPYDAAYLELAMRSGLPLATLDQDLIGASRNASIQLI